MDIYSLKGRHIEDVFMDGYIAVLVLHGGTRVEVYPDDVEIVSSRCQMCGKPLARNGRMRFLHPFCAEVRAQHEAAAKAEREEAKRAIALQDTPALAALRAQLET